MKLCRSKSERVPCRYRYAYDLEGHQDEGKEHPQDVRRIRCK